MSDDRNRDWPFPGRKRYASLAERMKDIGDDNAEHGRRVLAERASRAAAPMPREPKLLDAADLRRIEAAHEAVVKTAIACASKTTAEHVNAVAAADKAWRALIVELRDKLDPGVGRDFG